MALLNLGDDAWLLEYESCKKLGCDIMEQLSKRRKATSFEEIVTLSSDISAKFKQYENEVTELSRKFYQEDTLSTNEKNILSQQLELLRSKYVRMQKLFKHDSKKSDSIELADISKFPDDQKALLEDGERDPENLSDSITKQKRNYQTIRGSIDLHNDVRIANESRNLIMIDCQNQICVYWIIFLLILFGFGIPVALLVWQSVSK